MSAEHARRGSSVTPQVGVIAQDYPNFGLDNGGDNEGETKAPEPRGAFPGAAWACGYDGVINL